MWTILKVFIEFITISFLFSFLVFWPQGMWDLSSPTRDQIHAPAIGKWSLNHWTSWKVPLNPKGSPTICSWKWHRAESALPSANPGMSPPAGSFLHAVPKDEEAPERPGLTFSTLHSLQALQPVERGCLARGQYTEWVENILQDKGKGLVSETKSGSWPCREEELLRSSWGDVMFQPSSFWPY